MSASESTTKISKASPRRKARYAGALFLLAVLVAGAGEALLHGKLAIVAGLIAVALNLGMTALVYSLFRPVNRSIALLALSLNFAGLGLEALRWNPGGVDVALVLHGFYCVLIGWLIFKSDFLPRFLGALMAIGGLAWVSYASPAFPDRLSPYNVVIGLLGEGSVMLWFLVFGVNELRWKDQAAAAPDPQSRRTMQEGRGN